LNNNNLCPCCREKIKMFCDETHLKQTTVFKYLEIICEPFKYSFNIRRSIHLIFEKINTTNDFRNFMMIIMEKDPYRSKSISNYVFQKYVLCVDIDLNNLNNLL